MSASQKIIQPTLSNSKPRPETIDLTLGSSPKAVQYKIDTMHLNQRQQPPHGQAIFNPGDENAYEPLRTIRSKEDLADARRYLPELTANLCGNPRPTVKSASFKDVNAAETEAQYQPKTGRRVPPADNGSSWDKYRGWHHFHIVFDVYLLLA